MSSTYHKGPLPYTGFTALPLVLLGLALSFGGWVMRRVGRGASSAA
jgi:LPXTG-motif cell wall-anchored protein